MCFSSGKPRDLGDLEVVVVVLVVEAGPDKDSVDDSENGAVRVDARLDLVALVEGLALGQFTCDTPLDMT
jgi:hypothetical protein